MSARERIKNMAKKVAKYTPLFIWAGSFLFLWFKILNMVSDFPTRTNILDEVASIFLLLAASVILLHVLVKIITLFKDAKNKNEVNWKKMFIRLTLLLLYAASLSVATYITLIGRSLL